MSRNVSKEISAMGDAEIDSHGRFAIPKTVRETIGIKKQVSWFSYGNCLVIMPRQHLFEELTEKIRKAVLSDDRKIEDIEVVRIISSRKATKKEEKVYFDRRR